MSAALASRPSDEDSRIEIVDPSDPTKTILVEEKYPGESQWYYPRLSQNPVPCHPVLFYLISFFETQLRFRLSQIAAAEEDMRAKGKIDKNGHLTNGKDKPKSKKHDQ